MARPHRFDEMFQRTNVIGRSGEQELTEEREVARKMEKQSGWGLWKGGKNYTEQCYEDELVKQKGYGTIPNDAVKQRRQELEKGEIPEN